MSSQGLPVCQTLAERYKRECERLPRPPYCSLGDGAAGIAYFLLRYGTLTGDQEALAAAAAWIALAQRDLGEPGAFHAEQARVFPNRAMPAAALYFGEAGVWCVSAVVAAAVGDEAGERDAVERFSAIADGAPDGELDPMTGLPFLLLGTAFLVEQLGPSHPLPAIGGQLEQRLAAAVAGFAPAAQAPLAYLGAAHGWCGIAHALLRWCQATRSEPAPPLHDLLDRLRRQRLESGLWPRRQGSDEVWAGWCHGSAGWVQLWTLAYELLGDEQLLALAGRPGAHAVAGGGGASLCCGLAGEAYAALELYRTTRIDGWLAHAQQLSALAARDPVGDEAWHSLWHGEVGVALLVLELQQPERAAMPLYRALR